MTNNENSERNQNRQGVNNAAIQSARQMDAGQGGQDRLPKLPEREQRELKMYEVPEFTDRPAEDDLQERVRDVRQSRNRYEEFEEGLKAKTRSDRAGQEANAHQYGATSGRSNIGDQSDRLR